MQKLIKAYQIINFILGAILTALCLHLYAKYGGTVILGWLLGMLIIDIVGDKCAKKTWE